MQQPSLAQEVIVGNARILIGDSRDALALVDSESVQCCVTSPPYWGLRDYEHPDQLGAEESPEQYVANLIAILREVRRVLRPDGTFWLNVDDGYARNGGVGVCGPNAKVGNTKKLIQKRNCWLLGPSTGSGSHPAVFPHELARRCILLGSRPGDVVLDPFSGSGTTGIVAVELRRKAILLELNETYARQSEANLRQGVQECLWT